VAEWFKAPVLKTGRGFRSLVSSNLTPSATLPVCRVVSLRHRENLCTQANLSQQALAAGNLHCDAVIAVDERFPSTLLGLVGG
jgi:hypothetical protein